MGKTDYFAKIKELQLLAKKDIGQNFLIDAASAERIVTCLGASDNDRVLEIGCGAGSLTYFLHEQNVKTDAIDIDEAMLLKVGEDFKNSENLRVVHGNALKWELEPYTKIIGNLPYYITSGIIERCILESKADRMVFMVQKEAARRLLSKLGDEDYSPLTALIDRLFSAKREFAVSRLSFAPIPHVDSAVISFQRRRDVDVAMAIKGYELMKSVFINKRKTLLNNLKRISVNGLDVEDLLGKIGIDPKIRPQDLPLSVYESIITAFY